jgi:hypothetical protein
MAEYQPIEKIKVSELRKTLKRRLEEKKTLIVKRNSSVVAVLLCVETSRYGRVENPRAEKKRLLAELEAAISRIVAYSY